MPKKTRKTKIRIKTITQRYYLLRKEFKDYCNCEGRWSGDDITLETFINIVAPLLRLEFDENERKMR